MIRWYVFLNCWSGVHGLRGSVWQSSCSTVSRWGCFNRATTCRVSTCDVEFSTRSTTQSSRSSLSKWSSRSLPWVSSVNRRTSPTPGTDSTSSSSLPGNYACSLSIFCAIFTHSFPSPLLPLSVPLAPRSRYLCCVPWALKLVFTSFPVGNIVPLTSEMSYFQVGNSWNFASTPTSDSEIRVGKYEFLSPMERSIRL